MSNTFEITFNLNESIVKEFFRTTNKKNNYYIKWILPTCIFWTYLFSILISEISLFDIILYVFGLAAIHVAEHMVKEKQIKRYLYTWSRLESDSEIKYRFDESGFCRGKGKKYSYDQVDSVTFSPKIISFVTGTVSWIFPCEAFKDDEVKAFQELIKEKISANKIVFMKK